MRGITLKRLLVVFALAGVGALVGCAILVLFAWSLFGDNGIPWPGEIGFACLFGGIGALIFGGFASVVSRPSQVPTAPPPNRGG